MSQFFKNLKSFDVYPKTLEDVRVRTLTGAAVSILSVALMTLLFLSEASDYLTIEVKHQLFVDTQRGESMRINLNISFPAMPCEYLTVDSMDISGNHQLDVESSLIKRRLNPESLSGVVPAIDPTACGSCYGAEEYVGQCCNTCKDVHNAYRKKSWQIGDSRRFEQCAREGYSELLENMKNEGCVVSGFILVNKVAGNIHMAPGKSFNTHGMHVHDIQELLRIAKFNLTHVINKLSFGRDFPGGVNPLDGTVKITDKPMTMHQYYIKIVPTEYEGLDEEVINSNQFSVTENHQTLEIAADGHMHGMPGIFFNYDLSPIRVKKTETRKTFLHFLTSVCAIIGGVFTITSLLDSLIYHSVRTLEKKRQLGKAH